MSTSNKVNIGLTFADGTTKTIGLDGVKDTEIPSIRNRVQAINANMSDAFKTTFTNETGSAVVAIGKSQLITTEEEVIYDVS